MHSTRQFPSCGEKGMDFDFSNWISVNLSSIIISLQGQNDSRDRPLLFKASFSIENIASYDSLLLSGKKQKATSTNTSLSTSLMVNDDNNIG